jgi:hypothetical protein
MVFDASPGGLFVQTGANLVPGTEVSVHLRASHLSADLILHAVVARREKAPPRLTSVAKRGFGLKILADSGGYDQLFSSTESVEKRTVAEKPVAPRPALASNDATRRFQMRLKQKVGSRSRTISVFATSPKEVEAQLAAKTGKDWEVLEIKPA